MGQDNFADQHKIETYKSMIVISIEAIKYLAVLNTGAALSLLTFSNAVMTRTGKQLDIKEAVIWFMGSFVVTGLCFLGSYITQVFLHGENIGTMRRGIHTIPMHVTLGMYVVSLGIFARAVWLAASALS